MPGEIFISYRRDDEAGTAGRIYDHLVRDAGVPKDKIFKDVDNIVPGMNFVREIQSRVAACELLLAVIGKRWLHVADDEGAPRLTNPLDFVRLELEAGLRRAIPTIPILVDGAMIPKSSELPESLILLCEQQGVEVRNARFDSDVRPLVKAIQWHQSNRKQAVGIPERHTSANKTNTQIVPAPAQWRRDGRVARGGGAGPSQSDLRALGGLFYLAESGDPLYLYELATRLEKGHGIQRSLRLARDYYTRAAKAGYAKALNRLNRLPLA